MYQLRKYLDRYTPTCVGKTSEANAAKIIGQVQPHVCGENALLGAILIDPSGTPPRVWGKPFIIKNNYIKLNVLNISNLVFFFSLQ